MPRRTARACVALCALAAVACTQAEPPPTVRNLLVVCFDTVRYDSFAAAAHADPRDPRGAWTPRALRFGNALAPAPWTVPSVASVLTGRDAIGHGAGVFSAPVANLDKEIPTGISPVVPTFAERLQDEGYETVAFVAHPWFESDYGLERGFDALALIKQRNGLVAAASEWLRSRDGVAPFFLYLHFMDAHRHLSWTPEQRRRRERELLPRSAEQAVATAPGGTCDDRSATRCGHYLAYVRSVAEQLEALAQVLAVLEQSGQLGDTIVILYSDHGEEFNDHGDAERARGVDPRGVYGLGHGNTLYQEQLHVPLWVWHPHLEGREVPDPVSLLDVMPTALGWMGLEPGEHLDGRDLGPWLAGVAGAPPAHRQLFATRIAYGPEQVSVVQLPWKRISGAGEAELYSLAEDPAEQHPVDDARVAEQLDAAIAAWLAREAPEPTPAPALSAEEIERLQSLGYLEGVTPPTDPSPD